MNNERTWNDQPSIVEELPVRMRFNVRDRIVELRSDGERHVVTAGNLFGSQSLACESLMRAVEVANIAANKPSTAQVSVPQGCQILEGS